LTRHPSDSGIADSIPFCSARWLDRLGFFLPLGFLAVVLVEELFAQSDR
jgi:hypothetical protein